jgi:hypothetical protein
MKPLNLECQVCQKLVNEANEQLYVNTETKQLYCEACFQKFATEEDKNFNLITDREIDIWTQGAFRDYSKEYLRDILTGKYDLAEARLDVLSFKKFKKY